MILSFFSLLFCCCRHWKSFDFRYPTPIATQHEQYPYYVYRGFYERSTSQHFFLNHHQSRPKANKKFTQWNKIRAIESSYTARIKAQDLLYGATSIYSKYLIDQLSKWLVNDTISTEFPRAFIPSSQSRRRGGALLSRGTAKGLKKMQVNELSKLEPIFPNISAPFEGLSKSKSLCFVDMWK